MSALAPLKRVGRILGNWAAGDYLPVSLGGTGATTAAAAVTNLGLGAAAYQGVATPAQAAALASNAVDLTPATAAAAFAAYLKTLPTAPPAGGGPYLDNGIVTVA